MKDVQIDKPAHEISIERVGIKDIKYPVRILKKSNDYQHTIADFELSVFLPPNARGTHMSRFVSTIERYKQHIDGTKLKTILEDISKTFNTTHGYIKIIFPYFIEKRAPISHISSIMETECGYKNSIENGKISTSLIVKVPVTTLCPCSKEISKYGAHNQRAIITLEVDEKDFIWFEDLIDLIERCASSPIYPLLKREDEKYVTERAYENPKFVEDLVREIFYELKRKYISKISKVKITVESDESIHTHKAFAYMEKVINGEEKCLTKEKT